MASRTTPPAETSLVPVSSATAFKTLLEEMRPKIAEALPAHIRPERILKAALIAANKNKDLLDCSKASVMLALMQAAELGLDPSGTLGSGYLVPFKGQCVFMPGYRGLIDLARRSGQIASIQAHVVFEGDLFEYELGLEPKLRHVPAGTDEPKTITHAYMVAILKDGTKQIEVMSRAQLDSIRTRSRAGNGGPWVTDYAEMCRKTVVRRGMKYLPLSAELERALEVDVAAEFGHRQERFAFSQKGTSPDAVYQRLAAEAAPAAAPPQAKREPGEDVEDAEFTDGTAPEVM